MSLTQNLHLRVCVSAGPTLTKLVNFCMSVDYQRLYFISMQLIFYDAALKTRCNMDINISLFINPGKLILLLLSLSLGDRGLGHRLKDDPDPKLAS